MMSRPNRLFVPLLSVVVILGCDQVDRVPTAPVVRGTDPSALNRLPPKGHAQGVRNFYPLDIGNRWQYAGESSKTIISSGGRDAKHGTWTREAVLTRTETVNGRQYLREEVELRDEAAPVADGVVHTIRWLRQDRSGLFELGTTPPHAPPFTETKLLAYPLHTGATWVTTEYPRTTGTVEGIDVLDTPAGCLPAWRIRIRNSGHLPQEESFVWYGRAGFLGMRTHLDFGKPDATGHFEIIEDQSESLMGFDLVRPAP